ncbi:MAG: ribonucleoside-diphosphate reductase subunit alpha [Methylococcaceae bacterium TMED69]|nr:MAG: ribonucleoside-diphosphate reductase subunit alpha [Methylococcaceae bacterium TMED69]
MEDNGNEMSVSNKQPSARSTPDLQATAPEVYKVIRRNGKVTGFDASKIQVAITKAFLAVEGKNAAASSRIHEEVEKITKLVTGATTRNMPSGGAIHIEDIQDHVELALMRAGHQKIARSYVLYREHRAVERKTKKTTEDASSLGGQALEITLENGEVALLDENRLLTIIKEACQGHDETDASAVFAETKRSLFPGVAEKDVANAVAMSARTFIEKEPNYTFVAARLLLDNLRTEALTELNGTRTEATQREMSDLYADYFHQFIKKSIKLELLDPRLGNFDLEKLGAAIKPERDFNFNYLGMQTLYDRYFIKNLEKRIELPQAFFMRVAMGLAINEIDPEKWSIKFYNLLSSFDFMSSTPTLFNSGTLRPQLSSCYLTTIPDDLDGIFNAIKDDALLSKYAGGLGNDWTPVRAMGAQIKGTNGKSQGVVPFLKVANDTAVAVNQGGKRKGAMCAYLETWHLDIEEFLELRKNTGDDRRRTHDMNTANWIPDLFMTRVSENEEWTLFSPDEVPDLHELYGEEFEITYLQYEEKVKLGEIQNFKKINALELWRKMLGMLYETGHPWITFKDAANLRSPQQHTGVIHSSNLCTEITLNTQAEREIAVCNLGSVNLANHLIETGLDSEKLKKTVNTAMRMLDNVIDYNYYSVNTARASNLKHRPVGLGIMGFQDALHFLNIPYASEEAIEFADSSAEEISYYAISASSDLATERGAYQSFKGSLWSKGILPIDSIELLEKGRGKFVEVDTSTKLDWETLRTKVRTSGMRNSNCLAIAPTATISNICGVSQSIEPTYQNLFVKSNLSGDFTIINMRLVDALKERGLWDEVMVNDLKYYNGSVSSIDRIPQDLKELYKTAFEIDPRWLVECASRRQKWLDQGQSLNLYMAEPDGTKLDNLYKLAWVRGLKTTYYLRTMGATHVEKSTLADGKLNAVQNSNESEEQSVCSITDPDCEACQ